MESNRFALIAGFAFGLAFVGISWSQRGFPVTTMHIEPLKPDARIPTFEQSVKADVREDRESPKAVREERESPKAGREERESPKPAQSDEDRERDQLRIELLQAAIGYKLSPCDFGMKKNLVSAVTHYISAWQAKLHCKAGADDCPNSEDRRIDAATAAFKTAADVNVQKQLREAYDQGGIARADFPAGVARYAFSWTGTPSSETAACKPVAREAENRR